jgi:hypothetical protein
MVAGATIATAVPQALPPPAGHLNDFAQIVDGGSAFDLVRLTDRLRRDTQAELVLVTLRSSGGREANDYAEQIREIWGLGGEHGENHPVVLVLYVVGDGAFGISYNDVARPYLPHAALDDAFDLARPELEAGRAGSGLLALMRALADLLAV